jgi:hypothetical protein
MVAPPVMPDAAAAFTCAGNPKIPRPKHSSIVSERQPKIKPGPGMVGHAIVVSSTLLPYAWASTFEVEVFIPGARQSVRIASGDGGGSSSSVHDSYRVTRGEVHEALMSELPICHVIS